MHAATTPSHRARRRSRIPLLALGGLLVGCAPRSGVQAPVPARGDTVRVTIGHSREVLEFRELQGDVLVLQGESGNDLRSLPLASVDELEAVVGHRSRGSNARRGAAWGLVVGAVVGAFAAFLTPPSPPCGIFDESCTITLPQGLWPIVYGVLGAPIGLIVGAANPTEVWGPVDATALDFQAQASAGGFGLQLSWRP